MANPLELNAPTDPIDRLRHFARDLAYGALTKRWPSEIRLWFGEKVQFAGQDGSEELTQLGAEKYSGDMPDFSLLQIMGYLAIVPEGNRIAYLKLTQKAFDLLEEPPAPPSVFISYGRKQSSAFGLLIESRLSQVGVRPFIDRSIDPGDAWHHHLTQMVKGSTVVVALLAPGTLNSPYVREELQWAVEGQQRAIPIWHGGFTYTPGEIAGIPDWLETFITSKHAIRVIEESAEAYHDAVEKLINRLGYTKT